MTEIKIIIDFDKEPNTNKDAKQVIYINGVFEPTDAQNIVGKYITGVELHADTKCLILTLDEELHPAEG
jgi:hypothetical protein